ncbi:caveolin-1-like [Amphiura filiformis]|uniref:caveolin-1-like n=1 Tax=Amphiura filiformis TaxID=82378 RepID=UPI003B21EFC0
MADVTTSLPKSDGVFKLTTPVEITFTEVFREPLGSEIPETVYNLHRTLFTWTERGIYTLFGSIFGTIVCIIWGIFFGLGSFVVTWIAQPALKLVFMFSRILTTAFGSTFRSVFDPIFRSCSILFSGIKGSFQVNVTGLDLLHAPLKKRRGLSHSDSRSMIFES